jgi:hypothetical protein
MLGIIFYVNESTVILYMVLFYRLKVSDLKPPQTEERNLTKNFENLNRCFYFTD